MNLHDKLPNGATVLAFSEVVDWGAGFRPFRVVLCRNINDITPWVTWECHTDNLACVSGDYIYHTEGLKEARKRFRQRCQLRGTKTEAAA